MGNAAEPRIDAVLREVERRRDELVSLTQQFVRIESVTGNEGPLQAAVEQELRGRDLEVDRWESTAEEMAPYLDHVGQQPGYAGRPNLVGIRRGAGSGRSLLLNAHVDTVPFGDPTVWSHHPLSGDLVGDRLYGRGACDMKGALASFMIVLDALKAAGIQLGGDVLLSATVGEENGGVGVMSTILRGYRADAALICEPTRLALVPAQGGSLVFRLTVTGKSAHGAVRDAGVSALEKFLPLFKALQELERERNSSLDHPLYRPIANKVPMSIGVVRAGDWASTVPESLIAEGRIGLIPGEEIEPFRELVRERLLRVADEDRWLREHPPALEWFGGQFAPAEVPVDAPICRAVAGAHERVTGKPPAFEAVTYGADMRLFIRFADMPCVLYGAGNVAVAHQHDEHISVDELLLATKTLACLLVDWCGVASS